MSDPNPIGAIIPIAARLARGDALQRLYEICENQKSISTEKLEAIVDQVGDKLKDEAYYLKTTHNRAIKSK